jgi:catechol 2,3-dioxygenase-like lactoylglutathione lyase family enzyme
VFKLAIPLIHVSSVAAAEDFYCNRLGFERRFAHRLDETMPDPCYIGLSRDDVWLHVSSFSGDGVSGGIANLIVDDVDTLYAEFFGKGVRVDEGHPVMQTWGTREMYVRDPDGNCLRFIGG